MAALKDYVVLTTDGQFIEVQAATSNDAKGKVTAMGYTPKTVSYALNAEAVLPGYKEYKAGGVTTPTPDQLETTDTTGETTPARTTETPTTPPATPPATTQTTTTEYRDLSHLAVVKDRLEQQIEDYNTTHGTEFSLDKKGVTEYLNTIGASDRTKATLLKVYDFWDNYQSYIKSAPNLGAPIPKNFADYLGHMFEWAATYSKEAIVARQEEEAIERAREFDIWWDYARKYGETGHWRPVNVEDFYNNYDKAQELLTKWKAMADEKEVEYTDEQRREWALVRDYASYREPGEEYPLDIEDYFANRDKWQQVLTTWQQRAGEAEIEKTEREEYALSPEEAAKRREEAYAESRYAAQERYRTAPEYSSAFIPWIKGQEQFSSALESFTERQYPSLVSSFKATQPRLTGFPTREEARAEATRREQAFRAWLPTQVAGLEEKYWAQRPAQRGERLWMQQPTMRTVNW